MISAALMCLAMNVYHEARSEPMVGQYAVAHVVINRVNSTRWPNDVCSVVHQGLDRGRHKCQFSWYCDGKSDKPRDTKAYEQARMIAHGVYYGNLDDFVEGATHYHAHYVYPEWAKSKTRTVRIDDHIFYRWD